MIHAASGTDGYKLSHGPMYPKGTEFCDGGFIKETSLKEIRERLK